MNIKSTIFLTIFFLLFSCQSISKDKIIRLSDNEVGNFENDRFGFVYVYPKTWISKESDNRDGCTYINPQNNKVILRFWGQWNIFNEEEDNFHKEHLDYHLISIDNYGKELLVRNNNNTLEKQKKIPLSRIIYEYYDSEYEKLTIAIRFRMIYDNRVISLLCICPSNQYIKYEFMFNELGNQLRLIVTE